MKKNYNITFIIFTKNEEKRITYPIKCFLPYGEVLISDDNSTDDTTAIARKLGARVIKRKTDPKENVFAENKIETDFIFKHVKTDWVFWGFADTMVSKNCLKKYTAVSKENKYKIVVQKLKTILYDNHEYFSHLNVTTRFFRKDAVNFTENTIHQIGKFAKNVMSSEILYLSPTDENSIYHFSTHTTESVMNNANLYSSIHGKTVSTKYLLLKSITFPFAYFFIIYILGGAFRYGVEGFFVAAQYSFYMILVYAKAYENKNKLNPESVEKQFVRVKEKLLRENPKSTVAARSIAWLENFIVSKIHLFYKFR